MSQPKEALKPKILVLDDERQIVKVFGLLIPELKFEVALFEAPEAALAAIASDPDRYDVVISDIRMPQMDGLTFAKKVRALNPQLPMIFMTGYPVDQIKTETMQLGHVTLLQKPFPLKETLDDLIPKLLAEKH